MLKDECGEILRSIPENTFVIERYSFFIPEYFPESLNNLILNTPDGQQQCSPHDSPTLGSSFLSAVDRNFKYIEEEQRLLAVASLLQQDCLPIDIPTPELGLLDAVGEKFMDLEATQQLLTVSSLLQFKYDFLETSQDLSEDIYQKGILSGKTADQAMCDAVLLAPHNTYRLIFEYRLQELLDGIMLNGNLDPSVASYVSIAHSHPILFNLNDSRFLYSSDYPTSKSYFDYLRDEAERDEVSNALTGIISALTTEDEAKNIVERIFSEIQETGSIPYSSSSDEINGLVGPTDKTASILLETLPYYKKFAGLSELLQPRTREGTTEWLKFLGQQNGITLTRIANTYERLSDKDKRYSQGLLSLFNASPYGDELAYYIFDIAEKLDDETLYEISSLTSSIINHEIPYFSRQFIAAYFRMLEIEGNNNKPLTEFDPEFVDYFYSMQLAIGKRTSEILAALHDIVMGEKCEIQVYREVGKETVTLEDPEVVISALRLLDELLGATQEAMDNGLEEVGTPNDDTNNTHFSYSYVNPDSNARCRITIRPTENPNAEARILWTVSPAIITPNDRELTASRSLLEGREVDHSSLYAGNSKGRKMREISMRLDLEKFSGGLSFDIGGTTHPEKTPLNNLLATVIAAGAHRLSLHRNDSDTLDNHVRETFEDEQSDGKSFTLFLNKVAEILTKTKGMRRSLEETEEAEKRKAEFVEAFKLSTIHETDTRHNGPLNT